MWRYRYWAFMYVWATVSVYVYMSTLAMTRSYMYVYEPPYLYDGWLRHRPSAELHYIRYGRLCLALSVLMCLGRERSDYDVLRSTGESHVLFEKE